MKTLYWKYRYARTLNRLLRLGFLQSWFLAAPALENLNFDLSECPLKAAAADAEVYLDES